MTVDTSWLPFWEALSEWGAIAVFIGIVLEGPELLEKFDRLPKWISNKLAAKIELIGWILVAGGIAIEIVGTHKSQAILSHSNAVLNKEAWDARREAEQMKTLVAWRVISQTDINELIARLSTHPSSVIIEFISNDPETMYLVSQLDKAFHDAKWTVYTEPIEPVNGCVFGIDIPPDDNPDLPVIRTSFSAAKIPFTPATPPALLGLSFAPPAESKGSALIFVGIRYPAVPP
jgi:hypothetical protein